MNEIDKGVVKNTYVSVENDNTKLIPLYFTVPDDWDDNDDWDWDDDPEPVHAPCGAASFRCYKLTL